MVADELGVVEELAAELPDGAGEDDAGADVLGLDEGSVLAGELPEVDALPDVDALADAALLLFTELLGDAEAPEADALPDAEPPEMAL